VNQSGSLLERDSLKVPFAGTLILDFGPRAAIFCVGGDRVPIFS
jgi:hypothetical protein